MSKIKFISYSLIIGLLLLSGTVYLTDQWRFLQPYLLIGTMFFILVIFLLYKRSFKVNAKLFITMSLFFISSLVSSLINQDLGLMEGALLLYFMYITLGIIFPSTINVEDSNKLLLYSFLFFHIPLVIVPIITSGINQVPYYGIFYNPNSFGTVAATAFIVIFARLSALMDDFILHKEIHAAKLLFILPVLLGLFVLILYSRSRTSFLSILIICSVYMFMLFTKFVSKGKVRFGPMVRAFATITLLCIVCYIVAANTGIGELLTTTVIAKIADSSNDEFSGRVEIWSKAIEDMKLFGNGRDYFTTGLGAHSTYMSLLGQYGIIPAILFIIFISIIAYYSYKYIKGNSDDGFRYLPLYSILSFIAMSVAEGMLFKAIMILSFCIIGVVSTNLNSKSIQKAESFGG